MNSVILSKNPIKEELQLIRLNAEKVQASLSLSKRVRESHLMVLATKGPQRGSLLNWVIQTILSFCYLLKQAEEEFGILDFLMKELLQFPVGQMSSRASLGQQGYDRFGAATRWVTTYNDVKEETRKKRKGVLAELFMR